MTNNDNVPADLIDLEPQKARAGAVEIAERIEDEYTIAEGIDGNVYALPATGAPFAVPVAALDRVMTRRFYREGVAVSGESMRSALKIVEAGAVERAPEKIHLRVAPRGPYQRYVDLGTTCHALIEVGPDGWRALRWETAEDRRLREDEADRGRLPWFHRPNGFGALPEPQPDGTREELAALLGLDPAGQEWRLIWGWLVAAYFPEVARPILWCLGPQGSGKSTRARMVLNLVDPVSALGAPFGKNERDDSTALLARYVPSWDNLSSVSTAASDWLCRLTTGVEILRRMLYSDDSVHRVTVRRTGVATSIVLPYGLGPDAVERLVLVPFERLSDDRRTGEAVLWDRYARVRGRILGAVLDDVAGVMANLGEAREATATGSRPRMADYAELLDALDRHCDLDPLEGFEAAYVEAVGGALADAAREDDFTAAVLRLVGDTGGTWSGTASDMLAALDGFRPLDTRAAWPRNARQLGRIVAAKQEALRAAGVAARGGKSNGARAWNLVALEGFEAPPESGKRAPVLRLAAPATITESNESA